MSNQISLTIPNDDPIALRAFGNALEEMAVAHGAEVQQRVVSATLTDDQLDELKIGLKVPTHKIEALDFDTSGCVVTVNGEQIEGFIDDTDQEALAVLDEYVKASVTGADDTVDTNDDDVQLATNETLDADGLPWDARIHSGNQERNADNTWRARRKPKDVTPEQWAEQVAQVREELFALMAIPVADPVVAVTDDEAHEALTAELGCDPAYYDEPESPAAVFGEIPPAPAPLPVATVADPVPPAPVVAADPVPPAPAPLSPVAATGAIPTTMAEFMTSLTKYGPKDPSNKDECAAHVARVNEIVARHGLVSVGQLAKRLDLIPQVYADLVKELGQ